MNAHLAYVLRRTAQLLRLVADELDPPILQQDIGDTRLTYYRT